MMTDAEYRGKITEQLLKAVLDTSIDPQTRVMHVRTNEVLKAVLMVAATFLSSDPRFLTRPGRKATGKEVSEMFLGYVQGAQQAGGVTKALEKVCPVVMFNDEERMQ